MRHENHYAAATLCAALLLAGCSGGPNAQLVSCQQDKEQLLATIREQRDSSRALREEKESLLARLDQAEKELARGTTGTRLSSRPGESASPERVESLPWRAPSGKVEAVEPPLKPASAKGAGDSTLIELARRDQRVQYDPQARTAQLDVAIAFDDDTAALTAEGRRQLDEVARMLKRGEAANLRVLVAGYAQGRPPRPAASSGDAPRFNSARDLAAARAAAVADYLDRHGIAQERLGITGIGAAAAASGQGPAEMVADVRIYLLERDAPVVGWDSGPTLRR